MLIKRDLTESCAWHKVGSPKVSCNQWEQLTRAREGGAETREARAREAGVGEAAAGARA